MKTDPCDCQEPCGIGGSLNGNDWCYVHAECSTRRTEYSTSVRKFRSQHCFPIKTVKEIDGFGIVISKQKILAKIILGRTGSRLRRSALQQIFRREKNLWKVDLGEGGMCARERAS